MNLKTYPSLLKLCRTTSTQLVPPLSLKSRKIAIVGEALGKDELFTWITTKDKPDRSDAYFAGKAGELLNKLLREVGVDRSNCHITNVVKVRPPGNKIPRLKEIGLTVADFEPLLKEELDEVKPSIIIPVGNVALKTCAGLSGITKWRGSRVECSIRQECLCFPTLHPSYIQRGNWSLYPFVRDDLKKAVEASLGIECKKEEYESIIDPSLSQSLSYIRRCCESESTVIDIETSKKFRRIKTVGLSASPDSAISIPFRHKGLKLRWTYTEHMLVLQELARLWQSETVKIAHNADFDFNWLFPLLGFPHSPIFCTMRAHALVYPEAPHDLGFVMASHTNMKYHKDERKEDGDETLWRYNCKDCIGTHIIYQKLVEELKEIGMWEFFVGYTMPFLRLTCEMERVGIRIDSEMFEKRKKTTERKVEGLQIAIEKAVGREINVNSPKQIGELLYDEWKLPEQRHHKTKKRTVDQNALNFLYARYPNKIFRMIMTQRHLTAKILGTYLSDKIIGEDGNVHTSFGVTVTGRLSSKESDVFNSGTDLQNQPEAIRDMYIPDEGHVFVSVDLANAENRVQALVANMSKPLRCFARGENVHLKLGRWIHGRQVDKAREPVTYRRLKNIQHGTNYGMGERRFATYVGKSVKEAKRDRQKYLEWVPELLRWHEKVFSLASENDRTLVTPFGRKRTFTRPPSDARFRTEAYAHIPQSTVADIIDIGGLGLWLDLPRGARCVLQIHDEWLVSLPEEEIDEFKELAQFHLSDLREIEWDGRKMKIPLEFSGPGKNWRDV